MIFIKQVDFLLIYPPYHKRQGSGVPFPLGLGYLSAAAEKEGFSSKIIDCAKEIDSLDSKSLLHLRIWLKEQLSEYKPRFLIGIGPTTSPVARGLEVITEVCRDIYPNLPIICGGPLASMPGQEWFFFDNLRVDAIVPGEGEYVLCNILHTLERDLPLGSCEGVVTAGNKIIRPNIIENLDELPFPYRDVDYIVNSKVSVRRGLFLEPMATMITSRGCPYQCSFCVSGSLRSGKYHRRKYKNIVAEMKYLYSTYGVKLIVFYDDCFFPSSSRVNEDIKIFASELGELRGKIAWQMEMRADIAAALEVESIKLLADIGCNLINIGIEKTNDISLKRLDKRISVDDIKMACNKITENAPSIHLAGTFILGGPREDEASVLESIKFTHDLGLLYAYYYALEIHPGTPLYKQLHGDDNRWWYNKITSDDLPWGNAVYEDSKLDRNSLLALADFAFKQFYNRESWHTLAHKLLGEDYFRALPNVGKMTDDRFKIKTHLAK